ncbi:MAG: ABC transporter ATP-binding protein [Fervidicoccaceae archaeon]
MPESALSFEGVRKTFSKKIALNGVSFFVGRGEIVALLGPNGSGKTTSLRIAAGLLSPDEGRALVFGRPAGSDEARRMVAYLPEDAGLYERLSGWENLLFYAMMFFGRGEKALKIAEEGAKLAGLGEDLNRPTGVMSKGMRRRIALARTLMLKTPLVLLDEPTSGLDVFSAVEVRRVIKEHAERTGISVLMSSHNMLEVERLCDRVVLMHGGKVIADGRPRDIVEMQGVGDLEEAFVKILEKGK